MLKNLKYKILIIPFLLLTITAHADIDGCDGRFPNPITDICWTCLFPINIGGIVISSTEIPNLDPPPPLICECPAPPPLFVRFGVGISFWEPARVAEVVRQPYCSPTLNGTVIGPPYAAPRGDHVEPGGEQGIAFYHVHWIQYPILNWLGMVIAKGACFISETFDVGYLSELDPLWDSDELSFLINPEAALFANPIAQAACVVDSVAAATKNFGLDTLFWCSGSQGSVYPLAGSHSHHVGGIDSSLAVTHKMVFKLHRQLIAHDTSTLAAICGSIPQPILRKKQYKTNLMYPVPWNFSGVGFGNQSTIWGAGREFPYTGEDFTYMVWRKRTCCAF